MTEIRHMRVLSRLTLAPDGTGTWFVNDVMESAVRSFSAEPINPLIDDIFGPDQIVEIIQVYHLLKGKHHDSDGTGGVGQLQAYVTVRNRDPDNPVTFDVFMSEIY
jgi:hypothetical protein